MKHFFTDGIIKGKLYIEKVRSGNAAEVHTGYVTQALDGNN